MKLSKSTIALLVALAAGIVLMLYPGVSDWWNSFNQSHAIAGYETAASAMSDDEAEEMLDDVFPPEP